MFTIHASWSNAKTKTLIRRTLFVHGRAECPVCAIRRRFKVLSDGRYWCGRCRKKYSLKQLAVFNGSKLGLEKIVLLARCFLKNYPLMAAEDVTGLSYPTVRRYYDLFREKAAKYSQSHSRCLRGRVVINGCYVGRKRNNNQAVVLGAVQADYANLAFRIVPEEDQGCAEKFLYDTTLPWSHIIHDGHQAYADLSWTGVTHEAEIHEKGQFKKTVPIERIWALFKTRIRRTYHHIWKEKLTDYLAEFHYKFLYQSTAREQQDLLQFLTLPAPTA